MKNTTDKNSSFCMAPFMHAHVLPSGKMYPCCVSSMQHPIGDLNTGSFSDEWNGDKYRRFRLDLKNNVPRPNECGSCYKTEQSNIDSKRIRFNRDYANSLHKVENLSADGFISTTAITHVDYRFSNLCNMSCRTCSHSLSSGWYKDAIALGLYDGRGDRFINFNPGTVEYANMVESQLNNLESINFAGGEPMLMPEHKSIVESLVVSGHSKNVKLSYNTNLSTLQYKDYDFTNSWPKFKEVVIGVSLDEIEDRAEYWRNGTKWDVIMRNLEKLIELSSEYEHIRICYAPTVSIFNIHRLEEYFTYFFKERNLFVKDRTYVMFNVLRQAEHFKMSNTSEHLKQIAYGSKDSIARMLTDIGIPPNRVSPVKNLNSMMVQLLSEKQSQTEVDTFVKSTAQLDKLRKQSIKEVAPELWFEVFDAGLYQTSFDSFVPNK